MADEIVVEDDARPPRSGDFFLTVFLLLLLVVLTAIFVVAGFGMGVTTITCVEASQPCNYDVIRLGALLVIVGAPLVALAGIVTAVVFIARHRLSFVVPLAACLLVVGLFLLGSWLVRLAVPVG